MQLTNSVWEKILVTEGPFGLRSGSVRDPHEVRARSVRGPFEVRSGSVWDPRGVRSGFVRDPFEGHAGFLRGPLGFRSGSESRRSQNKTAAPGVFEGGATAPPLPTVPTGFYGIYLL